MEDFRCTAPNRPSAASLPAYRGRLAPSPTGYLHLGHARTFWRAQQRAQMHHGSLILRNEDLDAARCQPQFVSAMIEDLRWFGLRWQEGPDCGGRAGPYNQTERRHLYLEALEKLYQGGFIYPCVCSRKDVQRAVQAPHAADEEPLYPGTCRARRVSSFTRHAPPASPITPAGSATSAAKCNWRFRVPEGETISFLDGCAGTQSFVAGRDFGDFVIWRHDDVPAYQLAVVVDDAAMQITEVVRGDDLLVSTARQLLLYRALGLAPPAFFHCPLMTDDSGIRLAKRHDSLSLRTLRERGADPEVLRQSWGLD
jgi:glutamyl/glutaminyl-tRNA synthetase